MKRLPVFLLFVVPAAAGAALLLLIMGEGAPPEDIRILFAFMCFSGSASMALAYGLVRGGVIHWFNSVRWTLLAAILMTVALVFVNVWLTAQLMFISEHDLLLTSVLLVFAGSVSAAAVFYMSGALIMRIHALSHIAEKLAHGDLSARVALSGKDELAELAHAFNTMADALQTVDVQKRQLEQARRDLIAWVSHDLRTPLAAIRAMNDAMLDGVVADGETIQRYQINTQKEIQHLARLIDDLFQLAQLDAGRADLQFEVTSLRDLISDTLGSLSARAQRLQVTLTGDVMDGIDMLRLAPDKIQRVLYNLMDNALNHTPPGGCVKLTAEYRSGVVHVSIYNSGSRIAEADLPHLFESFYRGEASRAQKDGHRGTGLGLAIARGFVEAHGGRIWVETAQDGVTFVFTMA